MAFPRRKRRATRKRFKTGQTTLHASRPGVVRCGGISGELFNFLDSWPPFATRAALVSPWRSGIKRRRALINS